MVKWSYGGYGVIAALESVAFPERVQIPLAAQRKNNIIKNKQL